MANGDAFLLQAGDCAESFAEFSADSIRDKLKIILQMAVALTYAAGVPVVKVGRIAGQFAKPRSAGTERVGDWSCSRSAATWSTTRRSRPRPAGPIPNGWWPPTSSRRRRSTCCAPSPRAASPTCPRCTCGTSSSSRRPREGQRYERVASEIDRALRFMAACGIDLGAEEGLHQVDFFTSHEALILPYEECLTRVDSLTGDWYDCSAHMVWVGDRTRQLDGAHLEFLSGINNPVGRQGRARLHPRGGRGDLRAPEPRPTPGSADARSPGSGPTRIESCCRPSSGRSRREGHPVVWACDPMHGNTFTSEGGHKTRRFDDILAELRSFFDVHRDEGTWPGGVHVELTGDDVTECLGGAEEILEGDLGARYTTTCDPRLNARQSLDLAFRVAEFLRS